MVGTPMGHHGVDAVKSVAAGELWNKPGGRPCGVRTFIKNLMDMFGQDYAISFGKL